MRISAYLLTAGLIAASAAVAPANAQATCGQHRAVCESMCTPQRVSYTYAGSYRRCTASCEPRWQSCLKTGLWVDLERRSSGGTEYAPGF